MRTTQQLFNVAVLQIAESPGEQGAKLILLARKRRKLDGGIFAVH